MPSALYCFKNEEEEKKGNVCCGLFGLVLRFLLPLGVEHALPPPPHPAGQDPAPAPPCAVPATQAPGSQVDVVVGLVRVSHVVRPRSLRRAAETEPPGPRLLPGTVRRGLVPAVSLSPFPALLCVLHGPSFHGDTCGRGQARVAGPWHLPGQPSAPTPCPGAWRPPPPEGSAFFSTSCAGHFHTHESHWGPPPLARWRVSQAQRWEVTCLRSHSKSAEGHSDPQQGLFLTSIPASARGLQPDIWAEGNRGVPRRGPPLPYRELCWVPGMGGPGRGGGRGNAPDVPLRGGTATSPSPGP